MEIINGLEMDWESVVVLQLATQVTLKLSYQITTILVC